MIQLTMPILKESLADAEIDSDAMIVLDSKPESQLFVKVEEKIFEIVKVLWLSHE